MKMEIGTEMDTSLHPESEADEANPTADTARDLGLDVHGLSRFEMESLALEGYRRGNLSEEQVRRLLGLKSRFDVHALLKERGMYLNYSLEDWEEDVKFSESWLSSRTPRR